MTSIFTTEASCRICEARFSVSAERDAEPGFMNCPVCGHRGDPAWFGATWHAEAVHHVSRDQPSESLPPDQPEHYDTIQLDREELG